MINCWPNSRFVTALTFALRPCKNHGTPFWIPQTISGATPGRGYQLLNLFDAWLYSGAAAPKELPVEPGAYPSHGTGELIPSAMATETFAACGASAELSPLLSNLM